MATMTEQVQAYLNEHAKNDEVFAEKMKNPRKSIGNCIKFIAHKAMEYMQSHKDDFKMENGYCGDIDDEICYGWANHYYDEENLDIDKTDEERKAEREEQARVAKENAEKAKEQAKAEKKAKAKAERKAKNVHPKVEQKSATDILTGAQKKTEDNGKEYTRKELKSGADCLDLFAEFFS